jgi:hypothetical protein
MRSFVSSPIQSVIKVTRVRAEDYLLTIICTMRVKLVIDGISEPLPEKQQPGIRRSITFDDGLGNSLSYGGDHAPYKLRTDLTLMGSGHVPGGRTASSLDVTFGVRNWRKSLHLIGDHVWLRAYEVAASQPKPFRSLSLRLENAFGGAGSSYNPWGKGFGALGLENGSTLSIANIHPAGERHVRWDAQTLPAGFGPLGPTVLPRSALRGTYQETWLHKRNPLPPEDFDWGFYNAAPPDQQFAPYLLGNETLFFEHLHPDVARFTSKLPGIALRVLVRQTVEGKDETQIEELHDVLDSVHVDMDAMTIDLTWRAVASSRDAEGSDVLNCYVAMESVEGTRWPLADHVAAFEAQIRPAPLTPPMPFPVQATIASQDEELLRELQGVFKSLPLSPALKALIAQAKTTAEMEAAIMAEIERTAQGTASAPIV